MPCAERKNRTHPVEVLEASHCPTVSASGAEAPIKLYHTRLVSSGDFNGLLPRDQPWQLLQWNSE